MYLDEKLREYASLDYYPFHMPGHKRTSLALGEPSHIDITEIDGFDDLHHETGILLEAEERAAKLWGAKRSFLLVNGSTCGILAAMSVLAERGSTVLIAENCHKSVRHGRELNDFREVPLAPIKTRFGIDGQISPEAVEQAFFDHPEARAVVLTSPTYEGIVSDIEAIAGIAHRHGALLLVDEAHGAHFGMHADLPKSAVTCGADLVVQSLHKTLPSLAQTAVLHLCTDRVPERKLQRALDIFETSSPSYVLLASMDRCIRLLATEREALFSDYLARLSEWYGSNADLKRVKILTDADLTKNEAFARDKGKLVLRAEHSSGRALMDTLRRVYHLELERAERDYAIAMTSICDTEDGFRRLTEALHELDRSDGPLRANAADTLRDAEYEIYRGYSL